MKESIISNCEKEFILKAILEDKRLDGRKHNEFRNLEINFGSDWGCCQVSLGETKVLAQVSCEVQQPKPTRPNEGLLLLFVELSPMGAPHFEVGRQSELSVQLNRLLEKCIKESHCVDLESLCITAEEKVWALRVDVNVLNHEGNIVDAASIAVLTALAHFRHPDVTITGEQIIIHDLSERDPIPVSLHHYPVCITYAIFNKGTNVVADPTSIEERVSEAQVVFGVNAYRELCGLHLGGSALATTDLVLHCALKAAKQAMKVVIRIKAALEQDAHTRTYEQDVGFTECIGSRSLLTLGQGCVSVQLDSRGLREAAKGLVSIRKRQLEKMKMEEKEEEGDEPVVISVDKDSAELVDKVQWHVKEDECRRPAGVGDTGSSVGSSSDVEVDSSDSSDIQLLTEISIEDKKNVVDSIELSGDSEEEETMTLHADELNQTPKQNHVTKNIKKEEKNRQPTSRKWYANSQW